MTSLLEGVSRLAGPGLTLVTLGLLFFILRRSFGAVPAGFAALALFSNLSFPPAQNRIALALILHVLVYLLLARWLMEPSPKWWQTALTGGLSAALALLGAAGPLLVVSFLIGVQVWRRRSLVNGLALLAAIFVPLLIGWSIIGGPGALALPRGSGLVLARMGAFLAVVWRGLPSSAFLAVGLLVWAAAGIFVLQTNPVLRDLLLNRWSALVMLVPGALLLFNGLWNDAAGALYAWNALSAYRLQSMAAGVTLLLAGGLWLADPIRRAAGAALARNHAVAGSVSEALVAVLTIAVMDVVASLFGAVLVVSNPLHSLSPALAVLVAFCAWTIERGAQTTLDQTMRRVWLGGLALLMIVPGFWSRLR